MLRNLEEITYGVTREAEAWFQVDREHRHLEWGSEGPGNYHGYLDVTGDARRSSVTVFLHTELQARRAAPGPAHAGPGAATRSQNAGRQVVGPAAGDQALARPRPRRP